MNARTLCLIVVGFLAGTVCPTSAHAQRAALEHIIRKAARVSDDVPIRRLDEIRSLRREIRESCDDLLERARRKFGPLERRQLLKRAVEEATGRAGEVIDILRRMDGPTLEAAAVFADGGRTLREAVGDLAQRGRYLHEGGPELLVALARYEDLARLPRVNGKSAITIRRLVFDETGRPIFHNGQPLIEEITIHTPDVLRFRAALEADRLLPYRGRRPTLADFGRFFGSGGDRAKKFWDKYVRPYWKYWLGTAALTAVLVAPDEYIDQAGELTEAGLEKLGRVGGTVLGSVMKGVAKGLGETTTRTVKGTAEGVSEAFLSSAWGIVTLVLLVLGALLSFRPTRARLFALFAFLYGRLARKSAEPE